MKSAIIASRMTIVLPYTPQRAVTCFTLVYRFTCAMLSTIPQKGRVSFSFVMRCILD